MNNYSHRRNARSIPDRILQKRSKPLARIAAGRSLREFLPLLPGEMRLVQACQQGEVANLGDQVPNSTQEPDNTLRVRAPFLRFLLLGGDDQAPVHEHGVRLMGAVVEGILDLCGCRIPHNVGLMRCLIPDRFLARDAVVQGLITLEGSYLTKGISADRLQCDGGLFLRNGFKATGVVRLLGAQIGGNLDCHGGQFEVQDGAALLADRTVVKGDVFFDEGFKATGAVRLLGAQIDGSLRCKGGRFEVQEGAALSADGAVVKSDVFFTEGFRATGEIRLLGAQIGGDLACKGGQFEVQDGDALSADRAVVKGSVFFDEGFKATGAVRLLGAQIGSILACKGGQFEVQDGAALLADGAVVKGDVFFTEGFKATGMVRLLGAQISGSLRCKGGQFEAQKGAALLADGVVVKGDVFFTEGFRATGKVRLLGAQIGGDLACNGGQFEAQEGDALSVDRASVKGAWQFSELSQPARVSASHMQVSVLVDAIDSWAESSVLDGLRYGAFGGNSPTQATTRLEWLRKQSPAHLGEVNGAKNFRPQPWRKLQAVLREMGHAEDARQIGIAFEQQLRKIGQIGGTAPGTLKFVALSKRFVALFFHALFGGLAGYGYRPMRLMAWMAAVWLMCGMVFWYLALPPHNAIGPSDPLVFQNERYTACAPESPVAASSAPDAGGWYLCKPLPAEYSTFSPLAYSLDVLLPLVNLGQENAWGPLVPTPQKNVWSELRTLSSGHFVRLLIWFETLFGWIGSLLFVGIVSGFARRTEE